MALLEEELNELRKETINMWALVNQQLKKTYKSLITLDKDLAFEVSSYENRVNALELKIDRDCENIIALFNPVAVDLRFVLAVLKINNNLERTGDIAEGIGKFIVSTQNQFDKKLLEITQIVLMFEMAISMMEDILSAFENENTILARSIFKRDDALDEINKNANNLVMEYINNNPDNIEQGLTILSSIRKLERVGDQAKNIAEEIIFYIEAKVLKHTEK